MTSKRASKQTATADVLLTPYPSQSYPTRRGLATLARAAARAVDSEGDGQRASSESRTCSEVVHGSWTGSSSGRAEEDGDAGRTPSAAAPGRPAAGLLRFAQEDGRRSESNPPSQGKQPIPLAKTATKQGACAAWFDLSAFPDELRIAGRRFGCLSGLIEPDVLLEALSEYAFVPDPSGQPHHAIGFTEKVARAFAATVRERRREQQKTEERDERPRRSGMRSVAEILGAAS